jgi:PhnB protein
MSNAKPIPDGYDSLIPVLTVRNGAQAIEWYKTLFGAIEKMRMPFPDDPQKIAHAELLVYGRVLMLNEENPQWGTQSPLSIKGSSPVSVMIYVENVDVLFAKAQSLGAKPMMPPMDMFWGDRFGKFIDPFGHQWAIATHTKDMTHEEMAKGAEEAFKQKCPEPATT